MTDTPARDTDAPVRDVGRTLKLLLDRQGPTETMWQTLQEVVDLAVVTVPGAETAGITVLRGDDFRSVAVSDESVRAVDRLQIELNEGPCLEAITGRPVYSLPETRIEERWPLFAEGAAKLGVRSMLACRLATAEGTIASLNLHSTRPDAFDEQSVLLAAVSSAHASVAVATAQVNESLRASLRTRQSIGEACGMLRERHGLTSDAAFDLLVGASQRLNVKLRDIAAEVVATGADPDGLTVLGPPDPDPVAVGAPPG